MRNKNAKVPDVSKIFTNPGSPIHILYAPKILDDGTITLVENGTENIQSFIDSFVEQTDIAFIIKQLQLGNTDVLSKKQPMYGDFTEMPKTQAELLQIRIDAERAFYDLPLDVRQKFNNSFNEWFASNGKPEWFEKMKPLISDQEVKDEVTSDAP